MRQGFFKMDRHPSFPILNASLRYCQKRCGFSSCLAFKFCHKPETGDILFDKRPTSHKEEMIINDGYGKFDAWVWGICLWEKKTIYLRGLSETVKLHATRKMLERYCLSAGFKVLWGIEAKKELLEKDLRGLEIMALRETLLGDTLKHFRRV